MDVMRAMYSPEPVVIDGVLNDAVWVRAESYQLWLPAVNKGDATPTEGGRIRLAWDDEALYVGVEFEDSDVVQDCDEDQAHHYRFGDVAEVFLKPRDATWYWEMYATPNGRRTTFFFPSRGRKGLPSCEAHEGGLRVGAHVDGTLNNWRDRDRGWSAELAIPRRELSAAGVPLDAEHPWSIFIGRYNYSRYLTKVENSSCPRLTVRDFHHHEEWAALELVRGD